MYYNCELLIGGLTYPVSEYIKNWDEIEVSFKRNDYDGVVRSFSNSFEFVKGARKLLIDEYKKNYLKSSANIVIYTRNNSWTWTERFRCALNFSTLKDDGFTLSINAIDDSVAAIIKARKSVQYEYSVNEVKDNFPLIYDRMEMLGKAEWIYTGESVSKNGENVYSNTFDVDGYTTIPMYIKGTPEIPVKGTLEILDVEKKSTTVANGFNVFPDSPLVRFIKPMDLESLELVTAKYSCNIKLMANWNGKGKCRIVLTHAPWLSMPTELWSKDIVNGTNYINFEVNSAFVGLLDRTVYFAVHLSDGATCELWQTETDSSSQSLIMEYKDRGNSESLNVIKPQTMLNRLLKSMNGGKDGLNGVIVPSGEKRLDNAMILAAESARKMPNAKVYSSFDNFSKWMSSVFGYVYDINDKTVTFRPRKDYFEDEVVKTIEDYNNYAMNINSSLIYSRVNVGYNKQDYDSVNGKDEFRFTNEYSTGVTMTENKLDIISPYRADAYGIEFLAQQIGEDTTDNSSDTDVFFVCVDSNETNYTLDRSTSISGVISPETMFNAMYSPTSMISANEPFLGGFISELNYASSDGNSSVTIEGKAENRDISINDGIFTVNEIEIETSDIEIPDNMTGIIQFEYQGKTIQGYYKSTDFSYTKTKSAKITLIEKK